MAVDEHDVRAGLRALTATPPPQPPDRAVASIARARTIRRRRALATAVAVAVPLLGIGAVVARPAPGGHANVVNWADQRDPALQHLADDAVTEWRARVLDDHPLPGAVKWLFSGRVPGEVTVVVAWAQCERRRCSRLVLAIGVPEDEGRTTVRVPWFFVDRELRGGRVGAPVSSFADVRTGGQPPDRNGVVVLAGPRAASVTWDSPALQPDTGGSGSLQRLGGGVFAGVFGYVSAPVAITARDADGDVLHRGDVGTADDEPGNIGHNRPIYSEPIEGFDEITSGEGQTAVGTFEMGVPPVDREFVVFARCLGAAPLRIALAGRSTTVPCDGRRRLALVLPRSNDDFVELSSDDQYAVFAVSLVRAR